MHTYRYSHSQGQDTAIRGLTLKLWWFKCRLWLVLNGSCPSCTAQLKVLTPQLFLLEEADADASYSAKISVTGCSEVAFCSVSDESCVRCKQRCLMKCLGKAQPPWSINICVCRSDLPCDLSPWTSEGLTWGLSAGWWEHSSADVTLWGGGSYNLSFSLSQSHSSERRRGNRREVVLLGTPPGQDVEQKLHQIIPPAESAGSHWSICSPLWITVPQIESCCLATLYISMLLLASCQRC